MSMTITVLEEDGSRVSIEVSTRRANVDVDIRSGRVRIVVGDGSGRQTLRIASSDRDRREAKKRSRGVVGTGFVSPQMEAAAVKAFLGSADATRLGRSLSKVYEAMDAVRRGQGTFENDEDGS